MRVQYVIKYHKKDKIKKSLGLIRNRLLYSQKMFKTNEQDSSGEQQSVTSFQKALEVKAIQYRVKKFLGPPDVSVEKHNAAIFLDSRVH